MKQLLEFDKYYHIYNRGNNFENIFIEESDYKHFLNLLNIYINPIAETYAWCLMKNHFHILVRIKEEKEIGYLSSKNVKSENPEVKWKTYFIENPDKEFVKKPNPVQQFKHLFNAYSRWFNIKYGRRGSLFEKNYERKQVESEKYLLELVMYIHNNPVNHGFAKDVNSCPWTSYHSIISEESGFIKRKEVLRYFESVENFKFLHNDKANRNNVTLDLIIE